MIKCLWINRISTSQQLRDGHGNSEIWEWEEEKEFSKEMGKNEDVDCTGGDEDVGDIHRVGCKFSVCFSLEGSESAV